MTTASVAYRRRRSIVVIAGQGRLGDRAAQALAESLETAGIDIIYIGKENRASRIASVAATERADAVELCLVGRGGVRILRELLRELDEIGRREVSIVVHRVP